MQEVKKWRKHLGLPHCFLRLYTILQRFLNFMMSKLVTKIYRDYHPSLAIANNGQWGTYLQEYS